MRHLLAVLLILCCAPVLADDASERVALAERLTELLEIKPLYSALGKDCIPQPSTFSNAMLKAYGENPGFFGGISPRSAYWPEVEAIYREYMVQGCAVANAEKFSVVYVSAYARSMALPDLRAAVAFYSSPAGQAMQAGNRNAFDTLQATVRDAAVENERSANLIVQHSIMLLKNRFKAEPK
jgi:hypothetical protein